MRITGGVVRSVYRASYPVGGRPPEGELESIRGELRETAERLASGMGPREVYRLFMDEVGDLLRFEGVDPGSYAYETDVARAQRMYRACLEVAVEGKARDGRG